MIGQRVTMPGRPRRVRPARWRRRGALVLCVLAAQASASGLSQGAPAGTVSLASNLTALNDGFAWAKATALGYAFEGDPVGKWYEAALPGREAFCMRDVSHQVHGGLALGLSEHTENMLRKFATNIAASRQWTSYWEIDRHDRPAPVDYRSDEDFWYNLPANFDVVDAAWRAFEWTGNRAYVEEPAFETFYRRSLTSYVEAWDANGDGLMESPEANGFRGIPTYWEGGGPKALTGADLVAAQYAANRSYAALLRASGRSVEAARFAVEAARLQRVYNDDWWNPATGRFYTAVVQDGSFDPSSQALAQIYPLYFGIVRSGARRRQVVEGLPDAGNVELSSYMAEVYYKNGRVERAFEALMTQLDPNLERRTYPENPFTAVGTIVHHLVGVRPLASQGVVETVPQLPGALEWIEVADLPLLDGMVTVRHDATVDGRWTALTNSGPEALQWRPAFSGAHDCLQVLRAGESLPVAASSRSTDWGGVESYVELAVASGEMLKVGVPAACTHS